MSHCRPFVRIVEAGVEQSFLGARLMVGSFCRVGAGKNQCVLLSEFILLQVRKCFPFRQNLRMAKVHLC